MDRSSRNNGIGPRKLLAAAVLAVAASAFAWPALSGPLPPQTKLRVNVIQWMPTKGVYERWDALGGEFVVSQSGTIALPVIGSVEVGDLDTAGLAAAIANRLQERLMLVDKPDTTVEILDYPPVYVVGDVMKPGEYRYREGMTVLQALALSGGKSRLGRQQSDDEARLISELRGMDTDIVRSTARIARLNAEMSGAAEIAFPTVSADDQTAQQIFAREKVIFATRANELERQTKSLADLRDLLTAEINVLQEKIKAADASIKSAETELANVTTLVEKGIAVASRKSDLERSLASYRTDRLDQVTAIMRAQQAISEANRNSDGLRDRQRTEVAASLQSEQAILGEVKRKRELSQKLLLDMLGSRSGPSGESPSLAFTITRRQNGSSIDVSASDSSDVMPGDVITVTMAGQRQPAAEAPSADAEPLSTTELSPDEVGQ